MARPQRAYSADPGEYTETLDHSLLMCSNISGNNNKFYSLELQKAKSASLGYVLFSHYGRIMGEEVNKGVYEVRSFSDETSARREFKKIIQKKMRGKTKVKDGVSYKEEYISVDVASSSVGSLNVKGNSAAKKTSGKRLNKDLFKDFGSVEQKILKILEEENVHEITTSTTIRYTANGLQTPLGPLTTDHIGRAKSVLDNISSKINSKKQDETLLTELNNDYLSLIPRNLGAKITKRDMILTGDKVLKEYDLLTQMETSLQLQSLKTDDNKDKKEEGIGFSLKLAPADIQAAITKQINSTRRHAHLNKHKVKRVYEVENFEERKRFEITADGFQKNKKNKTHRLDYQEVDLFHGSRNSNILSILMKGFYVPPSNAAHVTARMYGNGVYAADVSTKALNYSAGFWGGRGNKFNNLFCFVTRFALGKVYETAHSRSSGTPNGYNSIFAKGGHDLQNNEYIVPSEAQTTISYLVEFE